MDQFMVYLFLLVLKKQTAYFVIDAILF
jgi:hypothetical protein